MAKSQWTTKANEVTMVASAGTLTVTVPLYDTNVKAATLTFTIDADRNLLVVCDNEPGAAGLAGFQAWSTA